MVERGGRREKEKRKGRKKTNAPSFYQKQMRFCLLRINFSHFQRPRNLFRGIKGSLEKFSKIGLELIQIRWDIKEKMKPEKKISADQ